MSAIRVLIFYFILSLAIIFWPLFHFSNIAIGYSMIAGYLIFSVDFLLIYIVMKVIVGKIGLEGSGGSLGLGWRALLVLGCFKSLLLAGSLYWCLVVLQLDPLFCFIGMLLSLVFITLVSVRVYRVY